MGKYDDHLEREVRDYGLEADGLLDPDQPTESAHRRYVERQRREFSPVERQVIRAVLGLAGEGGSRG